VPVLLVDVLLVLLLGVLVPLQLFAELQLVFELLFFDP